MDAVAVQVVVDPRAECADRDRARRALAEALAGARAPRNGGTRPGEASMDQWTLRMTVAREGKERVATATLSDDTGAPVARRTLGGGREAAGCASLARAVGAWAALVLDDEASRAEERAPAPPPEARERPVAPPLLDRGAPAVRAMDSVRPERGARARRPRLVDVGALAFLRNGVTSSGGVAGAAPFAVVELGPGFLLRPALGVGQGTDELSVGGSKRSRLGFVGVRLDLCRRIPGNYLERRGLELDLCGGLDAGAAWVGGTPTQSSAAAARLGAGPAVALRGELGAGFALEIRGAAGANLVRAPLAGASAPLLALSSELGVSWRLP